MTEQELAEAQGALEAPPPRKYERGYGALFAQHVTQADEGCDFDFLEGTRADARSGDPLMELPHNAFKRALAGRQAADRPVVEPVVELHRRGDRRRGLRLDPARHRAFAERPGEPADAAAGGGALPDASGGARAVERHGEHQARARHRRAVAAHSLRAERAKRRESAVAHHALPAGRRARRRRHDARDALRPRQGLREARARGDLRAGAGRDAAGARQHRGDLRNRRRRRRVHRAGRPARLASAIRARSPIRR